MKTTNPLLSFISPLLRCGFVAAAISLAHPATAELIVHDGGDFRSHVIFFDMESDQVAAAHFPGADFEMWPGDIDWPRIRGYGYPDSQAAVMIQSATEISTTVRRLSVGDTVDSNGIWGGYDDWQNPGAGWETTATFLSFYHGQRGYIGLRLAKKSGDTTSYYYGWADITFHNDGDGIFTLHRWAIETEAGKAVVIQSPDHSPEPPRLRIDWDDDRALISWSAPSEGWALVSSDDLVNWEPVEGEPQLVEDRMEWRDPHDFSRRFYRLIAE